MSEYATERQFNEMLFTFEDYNLLKKHIATLEAQLAEVKALQRYSVTDIMLGSGMADYNYIQAEQLTAILAKYNK